MTKRIRIWYRTDAGTLGHTCSSRAYTWRCVCGARGVHHFNRFTDRIRPRRHRIHPWRRCLNAVGEHLRRAHQPHTPAEEETA